MRKIYLSLAVFFAAFTLLKAQVPTCSLNPTFIASPKYGIWPDSVTNFISGMVGVPYIQNITVKVPKDTVSSMILFCFNRFVLSNPTGTVNYGLPPGLNFGSSTSAVANGTINGAPSLKFPGNANNCASIYGTPTTAGTYTLHLKVDAFATPALTSCPSSPNVNGGTNVSTQLLHYYKITILPNTLGVSEINKSLFNLQNFPNPFTSKTTIKFFVTEPAPAVFTVHNLLGKQVFESSFSTTMGENEYVFDAGNLNSGVYFYTIKYKNYSETKRMVVNGN